MNIVVTPKAEIRVNAPFYGDASGMTAFVSLAHGQKLIAQKSGRYWIVSKKGALIGLRLTEAAMGRLFEEVKTKGETN